jgi:PAS domain-containing protein
VRAVESPPQRSIVLILARELASKLATAAFVIDEAGDMVYYNEAAEELLGRPFAEARNVNAAEWGALFAVESLDGARVGLEQMPGGIALLERRPAHDELRITARDGVHHQIAVTALPLFAHREELVGVMTVFWPSADG